MSTYKYKVIKGGKVIGEATTRADAEAAAKKFGGHVAELLAGKAGRTGNPSSDGDQPLSHFARAFFAVMRAKGGKSAQQFGPGFEQLVREGVVEDYALWRSTSPEDLRKIAEKSPQAAAEMRAFKPIVPPKTAGSVASRGNPPLEPHSAATLLDAVKPGAPQQIHGIKVARVGAGYSVDGKAMTRAQALKALEVGRKANPKAKNAPAKAKPASRKASGRKIQYV